MRQVASQTVEFALGYASPLGKIEGKSDGHSVSGIVCCRLGGQAVVLRFGYTGAVRLSWLALTSQEPARLSRGHERGSVLLFLNWMARHGNVEYSRPELQIVLEGIRTRECGRARRCGRETDRGKEERPRGRVGVPVVDKARYGKGSWFQAGGGDARWVVAEGDIQISVGREGSWGS